MDTNEPSSKIGLLWRSILTMPGGRARDNGRLRLNCFVSMDLFEKNSLLEKYNFCHEIKVQSICNPELNLCKSIGKLVSIY